MALRTQQIIAEETGIVDVIDPLGGSYYLERLTCDMEVEAYKYFSEIEKMGGILETVGSGQADVDIMNIADITCVILAPGLGDEIQARVKASSCTALEPASLIW